MGARACVLPSPATGLLTLLRGVGEAAKRADLSATAWYPPLLQLGLVHTFFSSFFPRSGLPALVAPDW